MIDISPVYARDRQLRLAFADLPDIGGIVTIDPTNAFASECYNCGPDRLFVTGGTIAAVPETSTGAMLLIGFAAIGFAGYRRCHSLAQRKTFSITSESYAASSGHVLDWCCARSVDESATEARPPGKFRK
jgi:hypothetical protein